MEKKKKEETGLKLNNKKTEIMACSPMTSCKTDGETMETVTDLIFLVSKVTVDGDYDKHEVLKRRKSLC